MRPTRPLAILAGALLLALAACGGSGDDEGNSSAGATKTFQGSQEVVAKDPERIGPAAEIEGAVAGGTITVYINGDPGPDSMDPTEGWSAIGNSIQQAYTSRSLTQYARDPESGEMVLVPDLATDLGTPNENFTEWTFTLRDDATWEDGNPVTPEEVAFGISRSMDTKQFPSGPGTEYSQTYFSGAGEYLGPYTDPGTTWDGVSVNGHDITIEMATTFPDMDYWGAFMAMGPAPLGAASNPPDYGQQILSNGPYKVESFSPTVEMVLVKNDQWDPASDPARHQYADRIIVKFDQDQAQTDQIMLSDNTESQTSVSDRVGSNNYQRASSELGDRLVQQPAQCTSFLLPDYTKITDVTVRKAIAYAYPYTDAWLAGGEVPGVTRVPADSMMPPGMAGKKDYLVGGEQFTFDPVKSQDLLGEAGYEPGEFELSMVYYASDPLEVAAQKQIVAGFEEGGFTVVNGGFPTQDSPYDTYGNLDDEVNKQLNLRNLNWCSDWPSALTMLPPMLKTGAAYNFGFFSEASVDERMAEIPGLPIQEQAAAWGDLDETISTEFFPIIPTAFRNDLFVFGSKIGNPTGDGTLAAPNYKDLFVVQ